MEINIGSKISYSIKMQLIQLRLSSQQDLASQAELDPRPQPRPYQDPRPQPNAQKYALLTRYLDPNPRPLLEILTLHPKSPVLVFAKPE